MAAEKLLVELVLNYQAMIENKKSDEVIAYLITCIITNHCPSLLNST